MGCAYFWMYKNQMLVRHVIEAQTPPSTASGWPQKGRKNAATITL
jgi:hypothetical protein